MAEDKIYTLEELESELKQSHRDFAREYFINGWNRVKAYMKAYPDCDYKSASASATRLLEDVRINQYVDFLKNDLEKACNISKARNLMELGKIAFSNITHLHDNWIELSDWEVIKDDNPDALSAIESIDTKTELKTFNRGGENEMDVEVKYVKIKLYSKSEAIKTINEMMGYKSAEKIDLRVLDPIKIEFESFKNEP
jgi:hypothetical protein